MTPIIHCSAGNLSALPRTMIVPGKEIQLSRCCLIGKHTRVASLSRRCLLPQSSVQLFQIYGKSYQLKQGSRNHILAAVGTNVTIEDSNSSAPEEAEEVTETPAVSVGPNDPAQRSAVATPKARDKRTRPVRKSEMPPVKNEELVPGASFVGKVRSIQPFGAFIDFGAFTDGLVHVSRMSEGYVKDVGSIVSIGQEVKVRIVEVNMESGRIALTMRDGSDTNKSQQRKEASTSGSDDKPKPNKRNASRTDQRRADVQKTSKFVKGQILNGTVKNQTRSGAFIALPDGEEGFLPISEESEGFDSILGNTSLQVGQEVSVRVLRISRGKVTLTMKKEQDVELLNEQLNLGVEDVVATNPFQVAFRKNKEIAAFLDEREKSQKASEISKQVGGPVDEVKEKLDKVEVEDSLKKSDIDEANAPTGSDIGLQTNETISKELPGETSMVDLVSIIQDAEPESISPEEASVVDSVSTIQDEEPESISPEEASVVDSVSTVQDEEPESISPEEASVVDSVSTIQDKEPESISPEKASLVDSVATVLDEEPEGISPESATAVLEALPETESSGTSIEPSAGPPLDEISIPENEVIIEQEPAITSEATVTNDANNITAGETIKAQTVTSTDTISKESESPANIVQGDKILRSSEEILTSEISGVDGVLKDDEAAVVDNQAVATSADETGSSSDTTASEVPPVGDVIPEEVNGSTVNKGVDSEAPPLAGNEITSSDSLDEKIKSAKASNDESGTAAQGSMRHATVSPALVKQLREETGAGMMDCKKALTETGGDIIKAQELLRMKGLASADKKASRATAEGRIGSYIHDNRIGVLIEVNCETDFVSRGEIFRQLVDDLAMQVAACPQVRYLVTEDVPEEIVNKEREIEMQKEDLLTKPEQIRSKIVDGRIRKRLEELALLEQPYIKDDKVVIKDWVKQTIATIGENIKVRRFVRYNLGEGLEKKSQDFAAEVAAQTAARSAAPAVPKDQPAENQETAAKAPTVAVSAALVKQLREETGAGMMDCKKALTETGGDLEKAQQYLRKKGLSSADKKSSRLAAEGRIASYIHDSRIGALIEVNCETDFVGRNETFKELVEDLAMQVVACPQVNFVSIEEIPESIVNKEKEIEMQREDLQSKPEHIREKIVEGRISKRLGELALLEQPFIKDDSILVKDLVKQTVAALGENIKVRRFIRFTLGENQD